MVHGTSYLVHHATSVLILSLSNPKYKDSLHIARVLIEDLDFYFPLDFFVGFVPDVVQVDGIQIFTDQDHIDCSRIDSLRIISYDIGLLDLPHSFDYFFHQLIQAQEFGYHTFDFMEKGMELVGPVDLGFPFILSQKQSCFS